jgi:hypothetical protein
VGAGAHVPCESPATIPLEVAGTDRVTCCAGPPVAVAVIRIPAMPPCVRVTGPPFVSEKSNAGVTLLVVVCGAVWGCGWAAPGDRTPLRDGAFTVVDGSAANADPEEPKPIRTATIAATNRVLMG